MKQYPSDTNPTPTVAEPADLAYGLAQPSRMLQALWEYIKSLSLSDSNKEWLAAKLQNSKSVSATTTPWTDQFEGKWQDDISAEEMIKQLRDARTTNTMSEL